MTTTVSLRRTLDRPQWEVCTPCPYSNGQTIGTHYIQTPPRWPVPQLLFLNSNQPVSYDPRTDSWIEYANSFNATYAAGSCGVFHPMGPTGTASAGTATTITTATTLEFGIEGHTIRLTGGTGAGQERTISSQTIGTNAVLTVSSSWSVTPDATTTYVLLTGQWWVISNFGASLSFRRTDVATQSGSGAMSVGGLSTTWGIDSAMCATSGPLQAGTIASGTATGGTSTTIANSGKAWTTNQWINFQVRITGGTGAGQVRTVTANTGTDATVSVAWSVTPDATSTYVFEGNDDWIYLTGNQATSLHRYAINGITGVTPAQATGNTWITLAARGGNAGTGTSLSWISDCADSRFSTENSIKNGQKLYSMRGGSFTYDVYDIPTNAWTAYANYWPKSAINFTTGYMYASHLGYVYVQAAATGRYFRLNVANHRFEALAYLAYPQGTATVGPGRLSLFSYIDGATEILFMYVVRTGSTEMFRLMLI